MGSQSAPGDTRLGTGAGHSSFPVLNITYAKHAARGGEKKNQLELQEPRLAGGD